MTKEHLKRYGAYLAIQLEPEHKKFISRAAKIATYGGSIRSWALPTLIMEAEKIHGISFSDWKEKRNKKCKLRKKKV